MKQQIKAWHNGTRLERFSAIALGRILSNSDLIRAALDEYKDQNAGATDYIEAITQSAMRMAKAMCAKLTPTIEQQAADRINAPGDMQPSSNLNFDQFQEECKKTMMYEFDRELCYLAVAICGEAGEVAEKVKKAMRDNGGLVSPDYVAGIAGELGDVLHYAAMMAEALNLRLSDIAAKNIQKTMSRLKRGLLQGSGDNR